MASWRVAKSLETLRAQVNAAYPNRKKTSDGTKASAQHTRQNPNSDHEPDTFGVVRALDLTHDPANGFDAGKFARALVASKDRRLKYVISNAQIAYSDGKWLRYDGRNPHTSHVHISVKKDASADDPAPWAFLPRSSHEAPTNPPPNTLRQRGIVATVFGGADDPNQSAYGGMVDPKKPGVALPYRFRGVRPKVRVFASGKSVLCDIVDVGPWNIDDPYWTEIGRRPQAESGTDKYKGRRTNLAGIDLTPAAAKAIGINGKGLVDWEFATAAPSVPPVVVPTAVGVLGTLAAAYAWIEAHPVWSIGIALAVAAAVIGFIEWRKRK